MTIVRALEATGQALSRAGACTAMAIVVGMVVLIVAEIVLRTFFDRSTYVTTELVGYGMAAITFLALGETLTQGGLIRVTLLLHAMTGAPRRLLELLLAGITLASLALPIWFFGRSVRINFEAGYTSLTIADVPLWIPELAMLVGMAAFWIQLLAYAVGVAAGRRDPDAPPSGAVASLD